MCPTTRLADGSQKIGQCVSSILLESQMCSQGHNACPMRKTAVKHTPNHDSTDPTLPSRFQQHDHGSNAPMHAPVTGQPFTLHAPVHAPVLAPVHAPVHAPATGLPVTLHALMPNSSHAEGRWGCVGNFAFSYGSPPPPRSWPRSQPRSRLT